MAFILFSAYLLHERLEAFRASVARRIEAEEAEEVEALEDEDGAARAVPGEFHKEGGVPAAHQGLKEAEDAVDAGSRDEGGMPGAHRLVARPPIHVSAPGGAAAPGGVVARGSTATEGVSHPRGCDISLYTLFLRGLPRALPKNQQVRKLSFLSTTRRIDVYE